MSTNWLRALADVPTFALEAELERRGAREVPEPATVRLPGLTIDPIASLIEWRGEQYTVGGRQMEVLLAIAMSHARGHQRMLAERIGYEVWRSFDPSDQRSNVAVTLYALRRRFPGLIEQARMDGRSVVRLVLDAPQLEAGAA